MREVFSELVQGKTDILYPVESFTHEVGCGYSAWINDERVLIGNREMMLRHGLTPPSEEWEARCSKDGERQLLYLAVSGKLFGVFGLEYKADDMVNDVIHSLYRRGISLLIKSDDCCLTEELIAQIYDLPQESVKILGQQERKTLGPELIFRTQSEGVMTHLGSFASFVGGLRAAENAAAGGKSCNDGANSRCCIQLRGFFGTYCQWRTNFFGIASGFAVSSLLDGVTACHALEQTILTNFCMKKI